MSTHRFAVSLRQHVDGFSERAMKMRQRGEDDRTHDDRHDNLSRHLLALYSSLGEPRGSQRARKRCMDEEPARGGEGCACSGQ